MENLSFKSYEDLFQDIKSNLHEISSLNFDLIVGIPKSGMVPAYIISSYLNLDCTDIDSLINDRPLQKGITRKTLNNLEKPSDAKKILIVDDSLYSGSSLKLELSKLPAKILKKTQTLIVYSSQKKSEIANFIVKFVPAPKIFEWNIFNNNFLSNTCLEIDGILCLESSMSENDDRYSEYIKDVTPFFLPTKKVFAIVTNRLEKHRSATAVWLRKHNIEYEHLIMLDYPDKKSRVESGATHWHKGNYYKKSKAVLFIESSYNQAVSIANVSGKPVYSMEGNTLVKPGYKYIVINNSSGLVKNIWIKIKHKAKLILKIK